MRVRRRSAHALGDGRWRRGHTRRRPSVWEAPSRRECRRVNRWLASSSPRGTPPLLRPELSLLRGLGRVMAGRLAGKVCLVTGTGGSIGRATALTFAREGAAVVGCDVGVEAAEQTAALVHGAGGSMVSLQPCLLDDPMECAKLVDLALREFGRLDVVFNLAGRAHFGELENVSDEDWDAARRDEVDLIFYLTRAAWPHLKASRGVVVNMASLGSSASRTSPRCRTQRTRRGSSE
jgi:hypothetical protein